MMLENAKVERLRDRHFLVGTVPDYGNPADWTKGKIEWLAMDELFTITEITDLDEHKKLIAPQDE